MKILLLLAISLCVVHAETGPLTLTPSDGGSMTTEGYKGNRRTSLNRRWFTLNDNTSPMHLTEAGVRTAYGDGKFSFLGSGSLGSRAEIRAYKIVFLVFDVWGDCIRALQLTDVKDVPASSGSTFRNRWFARESDAAETYTSVSYVDKVMLADGTIWRADLKAIAAKLDEIQLRVGNADLSEDPPEDIRINAVSME